MASDWHPCSLGDLVQIIHGFAFKSSNFSDEPTNDILLTPGNFLIGGGFKYDKLKYYDGDVPEEYVLSSGDLLVTMTDLSKQADTLGYPALVPETPGKRYLHNQRLGRVEVRQDVTLDKCYLFYLLCSREYRYEVMASATGTTVRHTAPNRIAAFRFRLPPHKEQRAIGCILGALDDKVELYRRMSRTLEETARAIFKSWFVDFDPVRAKASGRDPGLPKQIAALFPDSFENSEVGAIPCGWLVRPLSEIADVIDCLHSKKPERQESGRLLIQVYNVGTTGRLSFGDAYFISEEDYSDWTKRMEIRPGDLVVTKTGRVGAVGQMSTGVTAAMGRNMVGIRAMSNSTLPRFLKDCLLSDRMQQEMTRNTNDGTILQSLHVQAIKKLREVLPSFELVTRYEAVVEPIHARLEANDGESQTLAALRDTLLPKLISGELHIPDAERIIGRAL